MSLHLSKGTNNTPREGVGGLDVAQRLAERGSRKGRVCAWAEQGEAPHPPSHIHPLLIPSMTALSMFPGWRTASVLDLGAYAIHKCSKRAAAQKTAPSASEKTHRSFS